MVTALAWGIRLTMSYSFQASWMAGHPDGVKPVGGFSAAGTGPRIGLLGAGDEVAMP